jgi:hypothetical protein
LDLGARGAKQCARRATASGFGAAKFLLRAIGLVALTVIAMSRARPIYRLRIGDESVSL